MGLRPLGTMSTLGEGISRDPIGEEGGWNLYGAFGNNPLSWIDSDGRLPIEGPGPTVPHFPPLAPPIPDPLADEAWNMFWHLFAGDLGSDYRLSSETMDAARNRIRSDPEFIETAKSMSRCNASGSGPVSGANDKWTIEQTAGFVNMGRWQMRYRGDLSWNCSNEKQEGKFRCCCDCTAVVKVKVTISKWYTFRAEGFNEANSSWGIQRLNDWTINDQFIWQGAFFDSPAGGAFFVSARWNDQFSIPFEKCRNPSLSK
jgi:hypothetical protein